MLLELNMVQMENIHNFQLTFRKIDVTNDGEVSKVIYENFRKGRLKRIN